MAARTARPRGSIHHSPYRGRATVSLGNAGCPRRPISAGLYHAVDDVSQPDRFDSHLADVYSAVRGRSAESVAMSLDLNYSAAGDYDARPRQGSADPVGIDTSAQSCWAAVPRTYYHDRLLHHAGILGTDQAAFDLSLRRALRTACATGICHPFVPCQTSRRDELLGAGADAAELRLDRRECRSDKRNLETLRA